MTATEYLNQVKKIDHRIRIQKKKLADMQQSLFGKAISFEGDGLRNITNDNNTEKKLLRYLEYEEHIYSAIDKLLKERFEIEKTIDAVPDEVQREVLTRRYLLHQKFEVISKEMNYTERRVYQIHRKALKNISVNFS